ncbi:MAG: PQQ-binding-like beta-propeller repeat protein [Desulfuromonadales bacterium]|nr:PQQ-binding-like beta-propeller repeat protein [Desulfuromonadales bacterium]
MKFRPFSLCLLTAICHLAGCVGLSAPVPAVQRYHGELLTNDTVWSGQVLIDGSVRIAKSATLTIAPGSDVAFVRHDADGDGLGDGTLIVEGRLVAVGTREAPIVFRSAAADPQPGDWLEIRVDFSREVQLRYCEIRDSAYTLHAHFTRGTIEDCTIRGNFDGCRLGQASFTFRHNLIEHNRGKGINFRNSQVTIEQNIIRYNDSGIFLFENDRPIVVRNNNFHGNLDNFRLGDFYTGDVTLGSNWWGTADPLAANATIFDRKRDPGIGTVTIDTAPAWIAGAGPRDDLILQPAWTLVTDGYLDADPVVVGDSLYLAGWDGRLRAVTADGREQWVRDLGATLDATPVVAGDLVVVQGWERTVHALERATGAERWRFTYPPSVADDHRQGGLLALGDLVLVPAWNGTLYALDVANGAVRWQVDGGLPLRARPVFDGTRLYLAAGDGTLTTLTSTGVVLWRRTLADPLLSEPALIPGGVAVLTRAGLLVAFDAQGVELWRQDLAESCYYGAPVSSGNVLFVPTATGALWKIDAGSGKVVWRAATAGPVYGTPLVVDGRAYLGDNGGTLHVFGAESAGLLASYRGGDAIQSRPLLWQGRLLFSSRDGQLHALTMVGGEAP